MEQFLQYLFLFSALLTGLYFLWMLLCCIGWGSLKKNDLPSAALTTKVTVIIAARNEEGNIASGLRSLAEQEYPKELLEVIVVDDHSTDNTFAVAEQFSSSFPFLKIVHLSEGQTGKKAALTEAVQRAEGDLVLCTDADCRQGRGWIAAMVAAHERDRSAMLIAPVCFENERTLFEKMQSLELCGLMGLGAAAVALGRPFLCNGANMGYERKAFIEVKGYEGTAALASGDDVFLLHKMRKKRPVNFVFSEAAIVRTSAQPAWSSFLSQRVRWASKVRQTRDPLSIAAGILLFGVHFMLPLGLLLGVFYGNFVSHFLLLVGIKCIIEFLFLFLATSFYNKRRFLLLFLPMQLLYPLYLFFVTAGGFSGTYSWKGRQVS